MSVASTGPDPVRAPHGAQLVRLAPAAQAWRYAAVTAAPLLLVTAGCKLMQMHTLLERQQTPFGILDLRALAGDVAFAVVWALAATWLLTAQPPRWRRWTTLVLHALTGLALLAAVVDQAYFLATGAPLDGDMLLYGLLHLRMLSQVFASELTAGRLAALLAVPLLGSLALLSPGLRQWRRGDAAGVPTDRSPWKGIGFAAATALACAVWLQAQPLHGALQPLARSVQWQWLGALPATLVRSADAAATRPLTKLELGSQDPARRYNVVTVVLESARWKSTTLADPGLATTPFLAELAKRGTQARQAYTVVPHTTKALIPIHCGYPPRISPEYDEADHGGLPVQCLPSLLRGQGYATAFMTPAEGSFELNRTLAEQMGFDTVVTRETLRERYPNAVAGHSDVNYFGYDDAVLLGPALDWVAAQKAPFALTILTLNSHHPYGVPKGFVRSKLGDGALDDYHNSLRATDDFLRELVTGLTARGHGQDTLVVVVGDHGEGFSEHGLWQHDEIPYDEGLRVPLVVVGPGVPVAVAEGLRQNLDIVPTVLQVLGLPLTAGELPGKSLLDPAGHERLHMAIWPKDRALVVREGPWKVIHHGGKRDPQVFDLAADPSETKDIWARDADTRARAERLGQAAEQWKREVNGVYARQAQLRLDGLVLNELPSGVQPADIRFDNGVQLAGWQVERKQVRSGDAIWVTAVYRVDRAPGPGWSVFAHLLGPEKYFARFDHVPAEGAWPISAWRRGQYVVDRFRLSWPHTAPTGTYKVMVGMWNSGDGDKRAAPEGKGLRLDRDNRVELAEIAVDNPARTASSIKPLRDLLTGEHKAQVYDIPGPVTPTMDLVFGDGAAEGRVHLLKAEVPADIHPGDPVLLGWWFQCDKPLPAYTDLFVHLHGPKDHYLNASHATVGGDYLPEAWRPGEVIHDLHDFNLPADWPPGETEIRVGLWDRNAKDQDAAHRFGRLAASVPPERIRPEAKVFAATLRVTAAPSKAPK